MAQTHDIKQLIEWARAGDTLSRSAVLALCDEIDRLQEELDLYEAQKTQLRQS